VVVAAPRAFLVNGKLPTGRRIRIATEYTVLARRWIDEQQLDAEVIHTYGSTEVFPPDDADIIIDNTATGSTLRANQLDVIDVVCHSSTHLCVNRSVLENPAKKNALDNFVLLLKAALNARERVLIEFNISSKIGLDECVKHLPALRRPTVAPLYGGSGFAVRSAVPRSSLQRLIPMIRANGDVIVAELKGLVR
jgi:ATP phosphoribosyltransferase